MRKIRKPRDSNAKPTLKLTSPYSQLSTELTQMTLNKASQRGSYSPFPCQYSLHHLEMLQQNFWKIQFSPAKSNSLIDKKLANPQCKIRCFLISHPSLHITQDNFTKKICKKLNLSLNHFLRFIWEDNILKLPPLQKK